MDKGHFSCGVFIDLHKAFDTVNHDILLQKLDYYGFRGIINEWFSSYLRQRTQVTIVDSQTSDSSNFVCGVPQGSVLGSRGRIQRPKETWIGKRDHYNQLSKHNREKPKNWSAQTTVQ